MSILDIGAITFDKEYLAKDLEKFGLLGMGATNPAVFGDDVQSEEVYASW